MNEHNDPELKEATIHTEQAIIEAEKFRAKIADPPGEQVLPKESDVRTMGLPRGPSGNGLSR